MIDIGEFTERYVAVWNEPDANARRTAIAGIWSEDARACTGGADYAGLTAIEGRDSLDRKPARRKPQLVAATFCM
jgi:hypothetical protein